MKDSYDDRQMDTTLLVCPGCARQFYIRNPHTYCAECRPKVEKDVKGTICHDP